MENLWTPLLSFAVFISIFAVGDYISTKTKGLISSIVVGSIVYLIGFWTNIIPTTSVDSTLLPGMAGSFAIALLLVNLGTAINLQQLISEWKTVAIAVVGLVGLGIMSFTLSSMLFTREYALCAASPIAGGTIAAIITQEAAALAGRPELGGFAMLVVSFQMFIGMPACSYLLKKEATNMLSKGGLSPQGETSESKKFSLKIFGETPIHLQTTSILTAKVAIVAYIAATIAGFTLIPGSAPANYFLNPNIAYLLFGIIFAEIGFLDKGSLQKANCYGFVMLAIFAVIPGSFKAVTPSVFMGMIMPLVGTLILGAIGIAVFSFLCGKFLGYSPYMSVAIGLTALMGFPGTQIVTDEVVAGLSASTEEKAAISSVLLPRMLVGGFATVTIASVVFAGIVAPMIF